MFSEYLKHKGRKMKSKSCNDVKLKLCIFSLLLTSLSSFQVSAQALPNAGPTYSQAQFQQLIQKINDQSVQIQWLQSQLMNPQTNSPRVPEIQAQNDRFRMAIAKYSRCLLGVGITEYEAHNPAQRRPENQVRDNAGVRRCDQDLDKSFK